MPINREFLNGFRAIKSLERVASDPRIEEIEGAGLDDGRVFLHAARGFWFRGDCHTRSVGSAAELQAAMMSLQSCGCVECAKEIR